jgi:hypothetical protein
MRNYYHRITAMGKLKEVNSLSSMPGFTSETIATRLLDEDTLIRRHIELGPPANPYMPTSQQQADVKVPAIAYFRHCLSNVVGYSVLKDVEVFQCGKGRQGRGEDLLKG